MRARKFYGSLTVKSAFLLDAAKNPACASKDVLTKISCCPHLAEGSAFLYHSYDTRLARTPVVRVRPHVQRYGLTDHAMVCSCPPIAASRCLSL